MTQEPTAPAIDLLRLADKFPAEEIEWRIGRAGYTSTGKPYGTVLAYVTNRAIMQRLDEVCGPANWRNEYREWTVGGKAGVLCGISIKIGGEWVTKWDGAEQTDIEPVKGGLSDSMKRAAVQWGIGRYLYQLEEGYAVLSEQGQYFASGKDKHSGKLYRFRWNPPQLPVWALPAKQQSAPKPAPKAPAKPQLASQDQLTEIDKLCQETNTSLSKLKEAYKVKGDVPTSEAAAAMIDGLKLKLTKMKEQAPASTETLA
jgi:hypothetical protein